MLLSLASVGHLCSVAWHHALRVLRSVGIALGMLLLVVLFGVRGLFAAAARCIRAMHACDSV